MATGVSGGLSAILSGTIVYNGNLTTVEGASPEPGSTVVAFEPSKRSPTFLLKNGKSFQGTFFQLPARLIGGLTFQQTPAQVDKHLGRHDSFRGDEGQPIAIASIGQTGNDVTIHSVGGAATATTGVNPTGKMTIGNNLVTGSHVDILGAAGYVSTLGDNVTIGDNSVIDRSSIGSNSTIGAGSYIFNSTLPAGSLYAPGSIVINNVLIGHVQD